MNYAQLLEDIKQDVTRLYDGQGKDGLLYHNMDHTDFVVSKAAEIARFYELNDEDYFIVVAAAWYHDTGYLNGNVPEHEARGAALAEVFLIRRDVDGKVIQQVKQCIMATVMPQQPKSLLEQIVCDADLYHLGTEHFLEWNKKMKKEAEWRLEKKISKHDWRMGALKLLEKHQYHTDFAKKMLEPVKQENIRKVREKELAAKVEEESQAMHKSNPEAIAANDATLAQSVKKSKSDRPERGIETMFRISSGNHQRLSDMADNKAHIMITTTSIILSVLLSVLLRKLEDNPNLIIPTLLLLAVCVITMVFCILATRPSLPPGTFTQEGIAEKKVNLLFFGNFYKMSYEEYSQGMTSVMNDRDLLYGSLTLDVYSQGIVLGRKYRLLRIGYSTFMYGIIISVIAFVVAVILYPQ